jgi:hypothetical protein
MATMNNIGYRSLILNMGEAHPFSIVLIYHPTQVFSAHMLHLTFKHVHA